MQSNQSRPTSAYYYLLNTQKYEYGSDSQPQTLIDGFTVFALAMVTGIRRHAVPLQTFTMPSTISSMRSLPTSATSVVTASSSPTRALIPYI